VTARRWAVAIALVAVAGAGTGCGPKPPDYQSIWSTPATTTATTTSGEAPVPISTYLETIGIHGEAVVPAQLTDLTVTMPRPHGWEQYSNPSLAPGQVVITKGTGYPSATLLTFRLNGTFDVAEALSHADAEAEVSSNFKKLNGSKDNFGGFPSSMIEGTYDLNGQRMQTYSRIVFATGTPSKPDAPGAVYLVQLTITGFADEAAKQGPDVEAIIKGFTVAAKK
jgi:Probable lipoprotein LpqN